MQLRTSSCHYVHVDNTGDLEQHGATVDVENQLTGQSPSPLVHDCKDDIASYLLGEDQRASLCDSDLSLGGTPMLEHPSLRCVSS